MPDLDDAGKRAFLSSISYRDYIQRLWRVDDAGGRLLPGAVARLLRHGHRPDHRVHRDGDRLPGVRGLDLPVDPDAEAEMEEPYVYHFPDGNASLARLIVRSLIPSVAPGDTMEDVVTARFDYAALDGSSAPVRIRLRSTVVRVANDGDEVDVTYVRDGELARVRARHVILAGYHMMIPAIMPELPKRAAARPPQQREGAAVVHEGARAATGGLGSQPACTRSRTRWGSSRGSSSTTR